MSGFHPTYEWQRLAKQQQAWGDKNNIMGHYRTGILIAVILALLTAFEFWVAHVNSGVTFLMLIAAAKAILVIWFFMHVKRLWSAEGGH